MSLLPGTILFPSMPIGSLEEDSQGKPTGRVILETNWWLFFYNLCQNVLGTPGLGVSAVGLTELASLEADADDADAVSARAQQQAILAYAIEAFSQPTFADIHKLRADVQTALLLAQDAMLQDASTANSSGGASLTLTDGTNTVMNTAKITMNGLTVGGTSPNATLTASGGGSANVTLDTPPTSPSIYDDEFTASSLNLSKWSWLNQGTATATQQNGSLNITCGTVSGTNYNAIVQPFTGGATWSIMVKVAMFQASANATASSAGLMVRNSSTGNITMFGIYASSGSNASPLVQRLSGPTGFVSNPFASGVLYTQSQSIASGLQTPFFYLLVTFDGTNLNYFVNVFGTPGAPFQPLYSETLSGYLVNANSIGLCGNTGGGAYPVIPVVDFIRKVA